MWAVFFPWVAGYSSVHSDYVRNTWTCSAIPPSPRFPKLSSPWRTWMQCSSRRRSATLTACKSPTCMMNRWGICLFIMRMDTWVIYFLPGLWRLLCWDQTCSNLLPHRSLYPCSTPSGQHGWHTCRRNAPLFMKMTWGSFSAAIQPSAFLSHMSFLAAATSDNQAVSEGGLHGENRANSRSTMCSARAFPDAVECVYVLSCLRCWFLCVCVLSATGAIQEEVVHTVLSEQKAYIL